MRFYVASHEGDVIKIVPGTGNNSDCHICLFVIECRIMLSSSCNEVISKYSGIHLELLNNNKSDHIVTYGTSLYISRYFKIHEQANTILY